MKIDRSRIVDAALDLLNEVGLDDFTTRALAQRLDVRQPALYWHFRSKRALLDAMNEEMLARGMIRRDPERGEDWRVYLTENARQFRGALLAWRDGARVHAGTEAGPQDLEGFEIQLRLLGEAGMSLPFAMNLLAAISRYTVGCVVEEQSEGVDAAAQQELDMAAQAHPRAAVALAHYRSSGHAAFFEAGLRLLLDGAAAQLGGSGGEA